MKMMKMTMVRSSALLWLLLVGGASAQFKCTMNASDEDTCLKTVGDDDQHCAWCSLGGFAFCMSEQAAEAMEQTLKAECERFSGSDDDGKPAPPGADDIFPANDDSPQSDDQAKTDDDKIAPTDDTVPDDFWTCLQEKDQSGCDSKGCTWCTATSAGFSLCMTGPAAEQAQGSTFFDCDGGPASPQEEASIPAAAAVSASLQDPYDATCVQVYLQDQTEEACTSAVDQDGQACQWCSLAGMANLCLTEDQADMGQSLGITCETTALKEQQVVAAAVTAPLDDTACMMTFLQDHTAEGCASAADSEGSPCEYCPVLNGALELCLTSDQVSLMEQSGVSCQEEQLQDNAYDTSCITSTFTGTGKDGCVGTLDEDGNACRYCSVGGMASLCLTSSQADLAGGYGVACDDDNEPEDQLQDDPYDTSCIMAYLQDQSEEGCVSTMDEDGDGGAPANG